MRGLTARTRNQPSLGETASGFCQGTPFQPSRLNRAVISQCPGTDAGGHRLGVGGARRPHSCGRAHWDAKQVSRLLAA